MRDNKRNNRIAWFLILAVTLTYCFVPFLGQIGSNTGSVAYAQSYQDQIDQKKEEKENIDDAREEIQGEMSKVAEEIKQLQTEVDNTNYQISLTTQEIKNTEYQIELKKEEIKDKRDEIKDKEKEIKRKQKEIQNREKGLDERLVVMYKNGSVGFMDVLMGSNSISEFVSNVEMIQKIYENDVDILKVLEKEHKKLEKEHKELEEEKKQLQVEEENLKGFQAELAKKKETLKGQVEQLNEKQGKLDEKKKYLQKKDDELKAQADALISEIKRLQDASRVYEGGAFTWPVPSSTYISSSFGGRIHPIFRTWRMHTGTDIAASYGANIVAAASGKVIMASWYGGYGNCVMIDHGVKDGQSIVTLYGHCSSIAVSVGQEVQRGQVVAYVGSTGNSTGNHCHFEVRLNGNYVDPMQYFR